jgi:hypothetical protein
LPKVTRRTERPISIEEEEERESEREGEMAGEDEK